MQAAQTAAAEVCRLREPPRVFADVTRRMRPFVALDPRLISVRSQESIHTSHLPVDDVSFDVSFVLLSAQLDSLRYDTDAQNTA